MVLCVCRQPPSVRLFPSGPGFVAVSEAIVAGISSSCLLVATQATNAASALLRYTQTHVSRTLAQPYHKDFLSCVGLFVIEIYFSAESFQTC